GLHPVLGGSSMKAVHAVLDHLFVRSNRTDDGWYTDPEVLDGLHRALSQRPGILWQRHDAHVDRPQILDLGCWIPGTAFHIHSRNAEAFDADDSQAEAPTSSDALQRTLDDAEVLNRAVAARPADHGLVSPPGRRWLVLPQRNRRRDDRHGGIVAPGKAGEVLVADDHCCSEAAERAGLARHLEIGKMAVGGAGVAQPDRVVEVVDEPGVSPDCQPLEEGRSHE